VGRLDAEIQRARERAEKAIGQLEEAVAQIGVAAAAASWLHAAVEDGRFDRRVGPVTTGSIAPSSARRTANGEALRRDQLIGFCRELVEPPEPPARVAMRAPDTASIG
jgi:hypothetical protein